jgi:heptosyltransferase III
LKQWPEERWVELARVLLDRGLDVIVTGAPADAAATEHMILAGKALGIRVRSFAGQLDLVQTSSVLAAARLVVSVNTGIMHLAAAVGVPVVALHGPTNPARWGPLGSHCVPIVPDAPPQVPTCYLNLGFEFPTNAEPCMEYISVAKVLSAVDRMLLHSPEHLEA